MCRKIKNSIYVILFLVNFEVKCKYLRQPNWDENLNISEIEEHLSNDSINNIKCIHKCHTKDMQVFLITLSSGLKAIFKPRIKINNLSEVAASKASKILNQYLVPPTVLRNINKKEGSLQMFVMPSKKKKPIDSLSKRIISNSLIFAFIFGKCDWNQNKALNVIINDSKNIALIDNELIGKIQKAEYGKLSFMKLFPLIDNMKIVQNNEIFSFDQAKLINEKIFYSLNLKYRYFIGSQYIIHKGYIWIQPTSLPFTINFTTIYSKSTLKEYEKLDKNLLMKIWNIDIIDEYFDELFSEIINRKNQVLFYAKNYGTIFP